MFQIQVTDLSLSKLALAWCAVEERKRILRGLPLPGQLRPDLDPVQLAKALRRQRDRSITDVHSTTATFSEEPEQQPAAKDKPSEAKPSEEGKGISLEPKG